jgi:UDP-N-acetylmuramoylalanine-D-glutamate ligase
MREYLDAKSHLIRYQTSKQSALLPVELADALLNLHPKSSLSFFGTAPHSRNYPLFSIEAQKICLHTHHTTIPIMPLSNLDPSVFSPNWLIVYAALRLLNVVPPVLSKINPIAHRLERVALINGITFYNDSKSTTPASTQAALSAVNAPRTILFLGGLNKGIDRTPLIKSLQHKPVQVICFGKEAEQLHTQCTALQISSRSFSTLYEAFQFCTTVMQPQDCVLFSPAGSSFDLFENYEQRGEEFKALVLTYCQTNSIS